MFTDLEMQVLNALSLGMAHDRSEFADKFHATFDHLQAAGMIKPVFVLTERAEHAINELRRQQAK